MSASIPEQDSWGRGRWVSSVIFVFTLQLLFLWLFSSHSVPVVRQAPNVTALSLTTDPAAVRELADKIGLNDPTLFALASMQGFSGDAWLKTTPMEHQLIDWNDGERWLSPSMASFGADFEEYVRNNAITHRQPPEKPAPDMGEIADEIPPIPKASWISMTGELNQRQLMTPLQPPALPGSDILANTVVRLVVDAEGQTISAVFFSTNGFPAADGKALELARSARFKPLKSTDSERSADMSWGLMVFHWKTLPLVSTNQTAANP